MSGLSPGPKTPNGRLPMENKEVEAQIQVVCRLRPLNDWEIARNLESVVEVLDKHTVCVQNKENQSIFTYDRVCDTATSQQEMYDLVALQTLDDLFRGFNGTILAYGQTGTGKSHTMFGTHADPGIIPRISESIFTHIAEGSSDVEYTVSASYMEIYQEHILDLLDPGHKSKEYSIHESKESGVYVRGLSHTFVSSAPEISQVLRQGNKHRTKSATNMNSESSRSHAIFQVMLTQQNTHSGELKKSNLFLVDLAGSEKVDRTGAQGNSLEEAKKINLSLSVLGLVINSLTDSRTSHIPYRDSKLTRILQESLGGNSRTTLIVNVSPASSCVQETISTLRFGSRAKKIKNSVHVNTELSVDQLKARVSVLETLNRALEDDLKAASRRVLSPLANLSIMSPRGSTKIPLPLERLSLALEELQRKDDKIVDLEQQILDLKMANLRLLHDEDLKLFKLESALYKLNDKLSDVELINDNLRKHLLISEKIIQSRDVKIDKLRTLLGEQQAQVKRESVQFEGKLRLLRGKLETLHFEDDSFDASSTTSGHFLGDVEQNLNSTGSPVRTPKRDSADHSESPLRRTTESPISPRIGLNLRIVKPVRGGGAETTPH